MAEQEEKSKRPNKWRRKTLTKFVVTGGAGYIVHATLRNLEDESKVGLLKSLSGEEFEVAIQGCEFVFHLVTPLLHSQGSQYKDRTEATVDGVKKIGRICLKSGNCLPLKEDGITFKELMDETCWTPHNFSNPYTNQWLWDHTESKMLAERDIEV
ncbi:hypothetical protein H5410_064908 [Solanum commersonii]|uniref:Uncharacterized protein n=1 Tax=Solanum commersonii TaxID=4109 RepID=A0A9J5VYC9_SOLCO|nr:hypothetical protein H5410_064908 [Solanum commersonii]